MEQLANRPRPAPGATRHATRVAEVLLALLDHPDGLSISHVARRMQVSKSVVHRALLALTARDLVRQDEDGRYRIGRAGLLLGVEGLRHSSLVAATMPTLRRLHAATGETATVAARVWDRRVHLEQILSPHPIRMSVELGRGIPLHAGATGKAILAFAPQEVRDRILGGPLDLITDRTTADPAALEEALRTIRRDGVAVSAGERQLGARSVAAPILTAGGDSVGALTVCGPAERFSGALAEQLRDVVRDAAVVVSERLDPRRAR